MKSKVFFHSLNRFFPKINQTLLAFVTIFSLLVSGWGPVSAAAVTYYVDKMNSACSDTGAGTASVPFCTITKGSSVAVAGDTVRVLAGTYAETVNLNAKNSGTAGSPITYSAAPGVTVTGAGSNGFTLTAGSKSYIVIDGFNITGTVGYGIEVTGANHITLSNNHISYSGSPVSGSTRSGISIASTTLSTISRNTLDHNSAHGILLKSSSTYNMVSENIAFANAQQYVRNANGIRLDTNSAHNTILHNFTYDNEDSGLNFYSGAGNNLILGNVTYGNGDHGIDSNAAPNNIVIGNTVQGNVTVGINFEGAAAPGSGGATVANNILVNNGFLREVGGGTASGKAGNLRFDANSLAGNNLDYDLFYLNGGTVQFIWGSTSYPSLAAFQAAVPGQETHGLQADPLFTAPAPIAERNPTAPFIVALNVGDYHLTAGSPAIDSANSDASNEPTTDIAGKPRVDDPGTANTGAGTRTYDDRGAYEFQLSTLVAPTVTTQAVTNIAQTAATGNGNITDLGVPNPTQFGVVWDTALNPTIGLTTKTEQGVPAAAGAFTSSITGLSPNTLYHVRAYATNSVGTAYGADVTFTTLDLSTLPTLPTVTTQAVTNIAQTAATGNGNITDLGAPNPTQFGVVWDTALNPTIGLTTKTEQGVPAAAGAFTSSITGLSPNTLYHVRAYATNSVGTAYGADVTFTTLALPKLPTVTTQAVTDIAHTVATGNGNITDLGTPNPTQFGVVWGTARNPTIGLATKTMQGVPTAAGAFTSSITGLSPNTLYHVRAYATNSVGTAYGTDVTFTTLPATTVILTTSGSWTVPEGITSIIVEVWGGGGMGGSIITGLGEAMGGGGGGGSYSKATLTVTPGRSYPYVVGAGATDTTAGGDSYFNTTDVLAKGGRSAISKYGAAGGAAASGSGSIKYSGGNGAKGSSTNNYGGGGGSSAGTTAAGVSGSKSAGGHAPIGGGDGGNGMLSSSGNGTAGSLPGGGGGGAYRSSGSSTYTGGYGANGQIIISYFVGN